MQAAEAEPEDGVLQVQPDDSVTAEYVQPDGSVLDDRLVLDGQVLR